MDPVHGVLNTAVDVRDVERTHSATLGELLHLLHSEGSDVALQVLLLHLHLLRELEQQTGRAAQVEDCLREDWPEGRLLIIPINEGVKVSRWLLSPHQQTSRLKDIVEILSGLV